MSEKHTKSSSSATNSDPALEALKESYQQLCANDGTPAPKALAAIFRQAIATQQEKWKPGDKHYTSKQLRDGLGVSPRDIAKAMEQLSKEGLVITVPRRGMFVLGKRSTVPKRENPTLGILVATSLRVPAVTSVVQEFISTTLLNPKWSDVCLVISCSDSENNDMTADNPMLIASQNHDILNARLRNEQKQARMLAGYCDALVCESVNEERSRRTYEMLRNEGVNFCLYGNNIEMQPSVPFFTFDEKRAAREATEFLINEGECKKVYYFVDADQKVHLERREGWELGLQAKKHYIYPGASLIDNWALKKITPRGKGPEQSANELVKILIEKETAGKNMANMPKDFPWKHEIGLFCCSDPLAFAVMQELRLKGLAGIPIVSIDNFTPQADTFGLTTMNRAGLPEKILEYIFHPDTQRAPHSEKIIKVKMELTKRKSHERGGWE